MEIVRDINGNRHTFELSYSELLEAHNEFEEGIDNECVLVYLEEFEGVDYGGFEELYGVSLDLAIKHSRDIAMNMRDLLHGYTLSAIKLAVEEWAKCD